MARLNSWLSADVLHALGWALIHSLWQCVGLAALAAILMAFSRRPSVRYLIATAALAVMLAVPAATVFLLTKPSTTAQAPTLQHPASQLFTASAPANPPRSAPVAPAALPHANDSAAIFLVQSSRSPARFLYPNFLPSSLLPWLVGAWLCGVALFSLRFAGGYLLLEYRCRTQSCVPDARILALCHALQRQLGLNRAIRYLECAWLQAPGVIGWLRPVLLLPVSALTGLSEAQLRAIIAHELAHIRRHDFFVNLLQVLVETLLFYHPAVWWLNARIRAERELCCDEIAVSLTGDRLEYAKVLALMAAWEKSPALAMAANRGPLTTRIFHILGRKPSGAGRMLGLTGSILFLAAALGAANALFGIAYPIPAAHAKANFKAALSSGQAAVDHLARQILPASGSATNNISAGHAADDTAANRQVQASDHTDAATGNQIAKLAVPLPDAPQSPPGEIPAAREAVASNSPPPAPAAANTSTSAVTMQTDPAQSATAPAAGAQAAMAQALAARTCELPKIVDSVALEPVSGSDLMTVPVAVNGSPRKFLLDLGLKKQTEASPDLMAKLSLPEALPNGTSGTLHNANGVYTLGAGLHDRVAVHSLDIGGATAERVQMFLAKDGEIAKSASYDGFLTGNFFRQYDAELDFAGKRITWLTPIGCADPHQIVYWAHREVAILPVSLAPDGRLQMQAAIQGHVIDAEIDTSSARTVMRRDIADLYLGLKADTPDMMPLGDLKDGRHMQIYVHTFPQLVFADGAITAENVPVLIQDFSMIPAIYRNPGTGTRKDWERIPDLAIGMDVLSQLHMLVVPAQGKVYVTAAQPPLNPALAAVTVAADDQASALKSAEVETVKTTKTEQLRLQQAAEARADCTAHNQGPESREYANCVNGYLGSRYGWRVQARRDGSLHAVQIDQMPPARGNDTPSSQPLPGFGALGPAHPK